MQMAESCPFDVTPYKVTNNVNRPTAVNLNYTNQDFWSMKSRLLTYIQQNFSDKFSDFVESSIAIMLVENWAFIADTLSFKIDQIANEIFIDTVTEIDNAFRLAGLVGYKPLPPVASKCMWTARINTAQINNVEIPAPFDVQITNGNQSVNYELYPADSFNRPIFDESIIISAGKLVNSNIVGLQGQTVTDSFLGTGTINQSFLLSSLPVLLGSVRVYVNGEQWNQVDFFTDSQPRKEYRIEYKSDYSLYVIFGNNRAGLCPSLNATINVTYRVGGGPIGDIVTNAASIDALISIPNQASSIIVNFTNYTKGENGYSGDGVEDIRRKLPFYIKSQERAVTGEDYKTLCNQFSTPYNGTTGKATIALRHSGCSANIIEIFVLVKDGQDGLKLASSQFKAEMLDYLDTKKMITDNICIRDGLVVYVQVSVAVIINNFYKPFEDRIKSQIQNSLNIFFNLNNWDYGQTLKQTDVVKALNNVIEPNSYDISLVTVTDSKSVPLVTTRYFEIIRPYGDVQITFEYE
jgi:hypothetical protein